MPRYQILRHGLILVLVGLVFVFHHPIESGVGVGPSPIFYLPVVTLVAWYGGFGAGVAAVLTWGLLWLIFEIPPFGTLGIPSPADQFRMVVFLGEGFFASVVVAMLQAARQSSLENAQEAERYRISSGRTEAQLRAILDNSPAPIWLKDSEGRYLLVNRQFEALAQRRKQDVVGLTDSELFLPGIAEPLQANDRAVLVGKRAVEVEEVLLLEDKPRTFLSVKFPLLDARGEAYALGGIYTDITERRLAAMALRRERDFAEGLIDTAQVVVLVLDAEGRAVRVNRFLEQVTGFPPNEVRGLDWFEQFVPERDRSRARDAFSRALVSRDGSRVAHAVRTLDGGEREIEWAHRPLTDGLDGAESARVLAIGHDITALKEAQRRALQAERLAAIGQMVTGLAHESRNALQRSQACLEMLGFRLEDRPEALDLVAGIQDAQDDLQRLYEEVRCYAAPIHLDLRPCSLRAVLHEAWEHLELTRQGRNARLVERGTPLGGFEGDRGRLIQVFRNVLDNALAAAADPVTIEVAWGACSLQDQPAVEVALRDNGPGLDLDQRRNLFEPFFTTKTQGTGLGMAIVRRIVEAHEGTIRLGDAPAPGAEIIITLPRSVG